MKDTPELQEARERFKQGSDFDSDWRNCAKEELRFEGGDQWEDRVEAARKADPEGPRPCMVLNHARKHVNNSVNEFRSSRPSFKVLANDNFADPKTADMLNGLMRHIQAASEAHIAYDHAAWLQRTIGLGYFRIGTRVVSPVTREQEITINPIRSTFSVTMEPMAKHQAGRDATWCFVSEEKNRKRFEKEHPGVELVDYHEATQNGDHMGEWFDENTIRIAEYWTLEERETEVVITPIGIFRAELLAARAERNPDIGALPYQSQMVKLPFVRCQKMTGAEFYEDQEFPADYIPIVRVVGEERWNDGKRDYRGIIRDIIDPQRMLNYEASTNVERMSLESLSPWVGPVEAFKGYEEYWKAANRKRYAFLPYNEWTKDGKQVSRPSRNLPAPPDIASMNAMMMAVDNIRELSGQPQASFGGEGNEKSGRALMAKQHQADINTFHFDDNMSVSMSHAGRIVLSMIPRVYDTERVVRTLGEDDEPSTAQLVLSGAPYQEQQDAAGAITRLYDLGVGTYDVTVTTGPSYLTRRTEAAEGAVQLLSNNPQLWSVIGDWVVRMLNWPGAEEIADRLKAMLPPEIQQLERAKTEGRDAATGEIQAVQQAIMAQVQPIIAELQQALEMAGAEVDEKDTKIAELVGQLEDKAAEYEIKVLEIQQKDADSIRDHEADMARVRADLLSKGMEGESNVVEHPAMNDSTKALDALVVNQISGHLSQGLSTLSEQVAGMADQMTAMGEQMQMLAAENAQLQQSMAESEKRREQVKAGVVEFLKTDDESALNRAIAS